MKSEANHLALFCGDGLKGNSFSFFFSLKATFNPSRLLIIFSWIIHCHWKYHSSSSCSAVVQKVDKAIHWVNLGKCTIGFPTVGCNTYLLNSDLSSGYRYPTFEQPKPGNSYIKLKSNESFGWLSQSPKS